MSYLERFPWLGRSVFSLPLPAGESSLNEWEAVFTLVACRGERSVWENTEPWAHRAGASCASLDFGVRGKLRREQVWAGGGTVPTWPLWSWSKSCSNLCAAGTLVAIHCHGWQCYSDHFLVRKSFHAFKPRWSHQALKSNLAASPHPQHPELSRYEGCANKRGIKNNKIVIWLVNLINERWWLHSDVSVTSVVIFRC